MSNQLAEALRLMVSAFDHGDVMASEGAAIDAAKQALAAHEAAKPEPLAWLVCSVNKDGSLSLEHAAAWRESAHEHINDAINSFGIREAARWVVRPAYAAPVAVASQWQPIETAPKDGSLLLLKEKWEDEPFIGQWVNSAYGGRWAASRTHYDTDGNACVIDRVYSEGVAHWMPLPPAPKEQQHE